MIARLKPGATLAQAQAQIDAQNATLEADDPQAKMIAEAGFRSVVAPLHADHVRTIRPALLWMQAGAFALLLIGAVNLTNLLLIRASSRSKEIAVRRALGASRLHVISEAIVETTLLTLAGGLLGLAAGAGGIRLLSVLAVDRLPLGRHIAIDYRLACIAVLGAVVMGVALAAPIAWFNLRGHLSQRDPIGDPRRNRRPRRSKPALRLYRGADRVGDGSVERGGSAGPQSGAGHDSFSGLSAGPCSVGTNLRAGEQIPGLAGAPGIQREAVKGHRAPAGSYGRRRGQQCTLER